MIVFDSSQIVFDPETTGTEATDRVVEIGAVVIDRSGEVVSEFETLVWQNPALLNSPKSAEAFSIHNIDRGQILENGLSEQLAGEAFANWIKESKDIFGARCIRAFNQVFDFGMIRGSPLDPSKHKGGDIPEGDCIMLAAWKSMHEAGALVIHPGKSADADYYGAVTGVPVPEDDIGRFKWPKATEAATFYASLGYHIPDEVEHRALPDARREAAIAVAIRLENMKIFEGKRR